jgi:hypothetical protein
VAAALLGCAIAGCGKDGSGIQVGSVCCNKLCGSKCSKTGCDKVTGLTEPWKQCCTNNITNSGKSCATNNAPCVVPSAPTCGKNKSGIVSGDVCCDKRCGSKCNKTGCDKVPGITDSWKSCCAGNIRTANKSCSTNNPPCVIAKTTPRPTAPPTKPTDGCGVDGSGIQVGDVCCDFRCGSKCTKAGCDAVPGLKESWKLCCTNNVLDNAPSCDDSSAPCVVGGGTTATPLPTGGDSGCGLDGTGIVGNGVCCDARCGSKCSNTGCSSVSGLKESWKLCCSTDIKAAKKSCDDANAPCVL